MKALDALSGLIGRSSLESPSAPLTGGGVLSALTEPGQLWTGEGAGDPLSVGTALRCVQILAAGVAGCPLRIHDRQTRDQVPIRALDAERTGQTPFELWETVVSHLALWGNAYVRKFRSRDGRLAELVPIHPARVRVKVVDGSAVGMPFVKKFEVDGGKTSFTEFDVMHVPSFSIDGITGLSVIGKLRRTFEIASQADRVAAAMFEQGMLGTGFLTTDEKLDATKAQILKDRWRAKLAGVDNAYDVAVMDSGIKFEQLTMKPADAQFLEARKFQTTEIARLFGVPGWVVNDQEKSTSWGSGMEQQFIAFVVITLKPYFQRIEQRVTREICDPTAEKAEFKVEGLLRGDSKARAAFYASGIQHGWLTPNEPRELEDLPPVPWGDEPYRPFNKSASDSDGDDTQPGGADDDDRDS